MRSALLRDRPHVLLLPLTFDGPLLPAAGPFSPLLKMRAYLALCTVIHCCHVDCQFVVQSEIALSEVLRLEVAINCLMILYR